MKPTAERRHQSAEAGRFERAAGDRRVLVGSVEPCAGQRDGWAMTPSGLRGVLNDAVSIHFIDATLASAFVARWCAGFTAETNDGVSRIRDDEPAPRIGAALHRTP
jgi:hypothetical protein